jgi:hypothetical protein
MSSVIWFLVGCGIGFVIAYLQHNPEKIAELKAMFKKKEPPA